MLKPPQDLVDAMSVFDDVIKGVQVRSARNRTVGPSADLLATVCNDARDRVTKYRAILRGQADVSVLAPPKATTGVPARRKAKSA